MPPVSARYRDARRRQITGAARRCFARSGFHATSMQDVFAESGLSAGAVYGYFTGKHDLVSAIVEDVLFEIAAALDSLGDFASPMPICEVVGQVIQVFDRPSNGRELARLAVQVWAEAGRTPELAARLTGYYHQMRARFTTLVQQHYQRDGTIDPGIDAHHVAQVLTALGPAFLSQRALLDDVSADTFTRGLCALLLTQPDHSGPPKPGPVVDHNSADPHASGS
jgi:AcrR family transcriptional regulator